MDAKKVTPQSLSENAAFIEMMAQIINAENLDELLRDLCEVQSLIRSHKLLDNDEFTKSRLTDTVHQLEVALRHLMD